MNELRDEGYLEEMRAHVPMGNLRRKVYVLSEVGMREARELRWQTGKQTIKLKDETGEIAETMLRDVPKEIRDGSTLLDIALRVKRGVFDKQAYFESIRRRTPFVTKEEQRPEVWHFFGREKELDSISDWFGSKNRILEVKGVAGIGKTALVATALEELSERTNSLWLSINDRSSVETLLEEIAAFLKLLGRTGLDTYLRSRRMGEEKDALKAIQDEGRTGDQRSEQLMRSDEVLYIMSKELGDQEALFVIDGCEKADKDVAEFVNHLLDIINTSENARIILAGRNTSKISNLKKLRKEGQSESISLRKLDFESSKNILQLRGVESWRLQDAYKQAGGLPLFLELMGPSYESQAADINGYLEEEVIGQLTMAEQRTLAMISIFNEPVHSDALFLFKGMKYGSIRSLVEKSLLIEIAPMIYETHDILKQFTDERLKTSTKKTYHRKAAEYYLGLEDLEDVLRGASHLIKAGDKAKAGDVLAKDGRRLVAKGFSRDLYKLLVGLESKKRHKSEAELSFLKGECLSIMGSWDEAIEEYDYSLLLSEDKNELERVAISLRKIADIQMWRGNYEETLEPLERSAEISEKLGDSESLTDCYYSLAALSMYTDELGKSQEYIERCLESSKLSRSMKSIAKAHKALGALREELGEVKEALRIKTKAAKFAEESGDLALLTDTYGNLAITEYKLDDYDKALMFGKKSLDYAIQLGDARSIARNFSQMASSHIRKEEYEKAKEYVDEASEIFESLKDQFSMAMVYNKYGYIFEESDWKKAREFFKKSLDLVDEYGSLAERVEHYANVGHLYLWKDDKKGLALVKRASALVKHVKNPSQRERLEREIEKALKHAMD